VISYYLLQTQRLLQNPSAPTSLYSSGDITSYINTMRGQIAGDGKCVRVQGTITTVIGQRNYNFSAINLGTPSVTGVQGVMNIRDMRYAVGSGAKYVRPRPWEWFNIYKLNNPVPASGAPTTWAQYGQGSAGLGTITNVGTGTLSSGSFYIDPLPDLAYTLTMDCECYPIALAADTDVEAIPYMWTDAIPFGAAWYALLSSQTSARMQDAEKYLSYYQMYQERARRSANPDVNKSNYEQQPNITLPNQLGVQQRARQ
jgi:hypothetical protein